MNSKLYNKHFLLNTIIIISLVYGTIMYLLKTFLQEKSIVSKLKNTAVADELLNYIENNLVSNQKTTTHFYIEDLPENIKEKVEIINNELLEKLGSDYNTIPQINEVYFTAKKTGNSDNSFTNLHSDSPFFYCDTYRFLVVLKPNDNVITIIPDDNISKNLEKYDILGFDYARKLHYIKIKESESSDSRIVLKLHFAKTNICNKLTKRYTRWARSLYVNNLNYIDYRGYGMLLNQFIGAYSLYFAIFYLTIAYIYFTSKNENILLMTILLTSLIITGFHFFLTLLFYFIDY